MMSTPFQEHRNDKQFLLQALRATNSGGTSPQNMNVPYLFFSEAVRATNAYWLFHFAADELRTDHVQGQCRAACGTGLVFTYYDTLLADICHSFPFAGASVPGGRGRDDQVVEEKRGRILSVAFAWLREAYDHVMKELDNPDRKGSSLAGSFELEGEPLSGTATVWFGDEPVWGHEAANGEWKHPSEECGRDQMPVPPVEGRDEKWLARLEGRKDSVVSWCCHWLRKVKEHYDAGEVICVAVSNIYGADWVKEFGAGSSELSDEAAELHGLQKEHFRNGRPQSWGEGKIRTSEGREFDRAAKVHPRTNKPLGAGCRWERWALDQQPFPVYAFFRP
ncbi:ANK1 [Symbiodinium natans]|uniref:ANK1 protein n=1 Tax=Symbiodinium natans TaxID=878477 RepID=A0A812PIU9_9DINO|nr:ANK1 [Symbiodinium natans]